MIRGLNLTSQISVISNISCAFGLSGQLDFGLLFTWIRLVLDQLFTRGRWALNVDPIFVVGIGTLPLVRFLTGGTSLLDMGEWVATGIFLGFIARNKMRLKANTLSQNPPAALRLAQ